MKAPSVVTTFVFLLYLVACTQIVLYTLILDGSPFRTELYTMWMVSTLIDFYINVIIRIYLRVDISSYPSHWNPTLKNDIPTLPWSLFNKLPLQESMLSVGSKICDCYNSNCDLHLSDPEEISYSHQFPCSK